VGATMINLSRPPSSLFEKRYNNQHVRCRKKTMMNDKNNFHSKQEKKINKNKRKNQ